MPKLVVNLDKLLDGLVAAAVVLVAAGLIWGLLIDRRSETSLTGGVQELDEVQVVDMPPASSIKGGSGARVAVLEFSDFECPFCGRYARETYPRSDARVARVPVAGNRIAAWHGMAGRGLAWLGAAWRGEAGFFRRDAQASRRHPEGMHHDRDRCREGVREAATGPGLLQRTVAATQGARARDGWNTTTTRTWVWPRRGGSRTARSSTF